MPSKNVKCVGLVERIGMDDAIFNHEKGTEKHKEILPIKSHEDGLRKVASTLMDPIIGVVTSVDAIDAVGHRVVHGGSKFTQTVRITKTVIKTIFASCSIWHLCTILQI